VSLEGPLDNSNVFGVSGWIPHSYNSTCGAGTSTLNVQTTLDVSWHRIRRSIVVVLMLCCILCVYVKKR
jgi:hypothetical protein